MMQPQDYLAAAKLIDRRGLCKGQMMDGRGAYCAIGAMARTRWPKATALELTMFAVSWWPTPEEAFWTDVIDFNDSRDTTALQVSMLLEFLGHEAASV